MSEPFISIEARSAKGRVILGAAILISLAFAWFGIRWQLGTMLAELTPPNDPKAKYAADTAANLAPSEPLAAWLKAETKKDLFSPVNIDSSLRRYEDVIRLAPNDYRWWVELGRVDEQAERVDRAEMAFRRSTELAPSYAFPRWHLGNFLLRENRPDEAFAELRKTTENDVTYREQIFSLAWDYFDHDPSKVEALAADTPEVRASLALFYAARGQAADSLRVWNTLDDAQKAEHPQVARTIAQALTEKKFYRQGLEFSRQVGIDPDAQAETVTNGGFEKALGSPDDTYYGWNVERTDNKLDIATDSSVKHQGSRALRLNFRTYVKPELGNPWQIVATQPRANYILHFWARTENLKSAGMPTVEVVDPSDNRLIVSSPSISTGTNDWQEFSIEFKAPEAVDGVFIRVARSYCGDACPIVGILWLDDFSLARSSH
jgi:tetratricopeptide (TPR) repeat protein